MAVIDPPIKLDGYPDEPINSTEAAANFIESHDGGFDLEGAHLISLLRNANTPALADEACQAFRQWAESCGLLSDAVADSPP
jgi:hypothetical protein